MRDSKHAKPTTPASSPPPASPDGRYFRWDINETQARVIGIACGPFDKVPFMRAPVILSMRDRDGYTGDYLWVMRYCENYADGDLLTGEDWAGFIKRGDIIDVSLYFPSFTRESRALPNLWGWFVTPAIPLEYYTELVNLDSDPACKGSASLTPGRVGPDADKVILLMQESKALNKRRAALADRCAADARKRLKESKDPLDHALAAYHIHPQTTILNLALVAHAYRLAYEGVRSRNMVEMARDWFGDKFVGKVIDEMERLAWIRPCGTQ